jgi:hypothetical protein
MYCQLQQAKTGQSVLETKCSKQLAKIAFGSQDYDISLQFGRGGKRTGTLNLLRKSKKSGDCREIEKNETVGKKEVVGAILWVVLNANKKC